MAKIKMQTKYAFKPTIIYEDFYKVIKSIAITTNSTLYFSPDFTLECSKRGESTWMGNPTGILQKGSMSLDFIVEADKLEEVKEIQFSEEDLQKPRNWQKRNYLSQIMSAIEQAHKKLSQK